MRICIDLTSLADNFSGIERYAASLSLEIVKNKDVSCVLIFKNEVHPLFRQYASMKNVELKVILGSNKLIFNQIKLPWILHGIKADWYLFMAFPVPILSFKKNMVSTIHDICCWDCPETMNGLSKWYFRISHIVAMKKCRAIITISEFSKKRIHERLKYSEEKIWLVYCGIDMKDFIVHQDKVEEVRAKYNLPNKYFLSLSTLEPRKNLRLLINAYVDLKKQNIQLPDLVLAGRKGWKMDSFLEQIDPNVKEHIIFTGFIDDEDLADIYGNAKLFVFPSMYEGFGMPPLEAMACGSPVISSDAGSLPEVIGTAGLLFPSQDGEALKMSIKMMNEAPTTIIEDYKRKGKDQVEKFSWGKEALKLISYLNMSC